MVVGSLKPSDRVLAEGNSWQAFIPTEITFRNYGEAFRRASFGQLFVNSVFITALTVIGGIVVNSLFGYALARFSFRGKRIVIGADYRLDHYSFGSLCYSNALYDGSN